MIFMNQHVICFQQLNCLAFFFNNLLKSQLSSLINRKTIQGKILFVHNYNLYYSMLVLRTLRFVRYFTKQQIIGNTTIAIPIKKGKKADRELTQLKRALMVKEPVKSQSLYDQFHHRQIYKRIDTDLEAFFYKRQYTLQNFNFLINLLGHQKKLSFVPEVLRKMKIMSIEPDQKTYNYMIRAAAEEGDIQMAQLYLKEAAQRFGEGKHFYTSLMQVYANKNDPEMAQKIVQEMIEKGIQPDLPVYTTLLNAFRIARKLQKCWEINRQMIKNKVELDEVYVGAMLKVHAASHDAEKAVKLYKQNIIAKNIRPMLQTTNSYLKALSTRPQYSLMVIDKFLNQVQEGEIFNQQTIRWALKACSTTANVKSAIEIIKIMKLKDIEPTVHIYNSLIRVYAKACDIPQLRESYRQLVLTDTWKILEEVISKNMLNTTILNNVMLVHANALRQDKIQGLILPLFQKFNLEMNPYTYEILVDLYYQKKDFNTAIRVWKEMKVKLQQRKQREIQKRGQYHANIQQLRQDLRPTFNLLQTYIQIGIRTMDMRMVLQALDMFKKLKRHPKNSTLRFLGTLKNLPVEIQTSLMDFQIRFGAAKLAKTRSQSQRNVPDPQNR